MGYNRSGTIRKNRLKRAKREGERLALKAAAAPATEETKAPTPPPKA
jgi:hypothetical protein